MIKEPNNVVDLTVPLAAIDPLTLVKSSIRHVDLVIHLCAEMLCGAAPHIEFSLEESGQTPSPDDREALTALAAETCRKCKLSIVFLNEAKLELSAALGQLDAANDDENE